MLFNRFSSNNIKVSIYTCINHRLKAKHELLSNNHNCFKQVTVNPHFWSCHCGTICLCSILFVYFWFNIKNFFFRYSKVRSISAFLVQELLAEVNMWFCLVSVLINYWIFLWGYYKHKLIPTISRTCVSLSCELFVCLGCVVFWKGNIVLVHSLYLLEMYVVLLKDIASNKFFHMHSTKPRPLVRFELIPLDVLPHQVCYIMQKRLSLVNVLHEGNFWKISQIYTKYWYGGPGIKEVVAILYFIRSLILIVCV